MSSGVYMIYCTKTHKPYIGQAENLEERKQKHFSHLKIGNHPCVKMQQDYNKYGENSFEFSILEECEKEKLNHLEDYYILSHNAIRHGYNQKRGNIKTISEDNFPYYEEFKIDNEDIVIYELENDRCENDEINCYMCLQTYIYEMNKLYNVKKTISEYINYISDKNTEFYICENNLTDGECWKKINKNNVEKIYDKYVIVANNLVCTNKYYVNRKERIFLFAKNILGLMDNIFFDDMSFPNALQRCEKEIMEEFMILENPIDIYWLSENPNHENQLYRSIINNFTVKCGSILKDAMYIISCKNDKTINDILNTNLQIIAELF